MNFPVNFGVALLSQGQTDDKAGIAWFGNNIQGSPVVPDNDEIGNGKVWG